MIITDVKKEGYLIHETDNGYKICKVLKSVETKEEAINELLRIMKECK